jgi:hypothetical protein
LIARTITGITTPMIMMMPAQKEQRKNSVMKRLSICLTLLTLPAPHFGLREVSDEILDVRIAKKTNTSLQNVDKNSQKRG